MEYKLTELSIELSAKCMCRCIMCSSGSSPKALPNELTQPDILSLIKEARELGATVLSFSGGDPLLQYNVIPLYVRAALDLGYEQILMYTTGASVFINDAKYWDHGDNSRVERGMLVALLNVLDSIPYIKDKLVFVFSLHSNRASIHDYIMGVSNAWHVTTMSISQVTLHGYQAWVHCVPMLPNWRSIPNLRELCGELGVEKMSLLRYVPQTRGRQNRDQLSLSLNDYTELQSLMCKLAAEPGVEMRYGCPIDFRHTVSACITEKIHPCHAGTDLMLVRPQGDVHPCAAWKTLPDDSNVNTQSLKDIWENSKVFNIIREFREKGWKLLRGPCATCDFLSSCKGGCPAQKLHWLSMNLKSNHSIMDIYWAAADPMCPISGLGNDCGEFSCCIGPDDCDGEGGCDQFKGDY